MKKTVTSALAALMAVSTLIPLTSTAAEARRGHGRGLAIGAGVLLGAAALAAAANRDSAYAGERRYRSYDSGEGQCRRWRHRCEDGSDWACRKYDRNC
ncbi:MAG: hypothetical protein ABL893_03330 [Hyphomicrobium sp.]|nr:hypothetical protein [Hyphomicrobium sp.]